MTAKSAVSNRHGSAVVTLPSDTEILITRLFDAPAELVFKAYTTPELVKRWWGFETSEWLVCDVDLRVGGQWRYVIRERGHEVGFHGEFREISRPKRIVSTEVYEQFPDPDGTSAALDIVTLDEADGVTTMKVLVKHARPEHRDAHIASGMESGMQISYNRLEDLIRQNVKSKVIPSEDCHPERSEGSRPRWIGLAKVEILVASLLGMTVRFARDDNHSNTEQANHGYAAPRPSLRRTLVQTQPRILRRHRADVGARHRCDDRDLQRRERRAPAAAALPEFRSHRPDLSDQQERRAK